jgi:hypothetical protein
MKTIAVWLFHTAILGMLLLCFPPQAEAAQWQTGRVLAAKLSGHGPSAAGQSKRASRGDIWWTYCFSADGKTFAAVSRASPAKSGLAVNSTVRFSIARNRMTVRKNSKERLVLRIASQEDKNCLR